MAQRAFLVASVLVLLYLAFTQAVIIAVYDPANVFRLPIITAIILAHALSMTLFLVTSYRQIRVRRPRLVVFCVIMLIVSNLTILLSLYLYQQDPMAQAWNEQMNKAMIEALESNEASGVNSDLLESLSRETPTYMDVVKSLGFMLLLMLIPAYVNLRPRQKR